MKQKLFTLFFALMTTMSLMAIGDGSGSMKANAIDFSWDEGHVQKGSKTLWYAVSLEPLYQEENPSLTLYLASQSLLDTVDVTLEATLVESIKKEYTILPGKHMSWTENAMALVRMKIDTVFIKLTTKATSADAKVKLSAKVYDAIDLDGACRDAKLLNWNGTSQVAGVMQWFKVDIKAARAAVDKDVKISITNSGSEELHLRAGQSMDCPSSGVTKRSFVVKAGKSIFDTIPQSMIKGVAADELYVTFDNDQPVTVKAEFIDKPAKPIYEGTPEDLHVITNQTIAAGEHFFRISVQEMNDATKKEPEFTFRNEGKAPVKILRRMSFENPVWGWQTSEIEVAAGDEVVEVIKKNVVEGIDVNSTPYVYILIKSNAAFQLIGRYKHVREGKACKSNIDFNWEKGHVQEAKTTQWYAIDVKAAKANHSDIKATLENLGYANATIKASVAFSCPYIDLQEATHTIGLNKPVSTVINYATYAMMTDTVWAGITTDQDIRISLEEVAPETKTPTCSLDNIETFDWENGSGVMKGEVKWFSIDMTKVRGLEEFPTVHVRNLSAKNAVTINGQLSLECPDIYVNQERELKIEANGVFTKPLSRNMFQNIKADIVYARIEATEDIAFEFRFTEEAEGSTCNSATDFNWTSGNDQAANANLWYEVDLTQIPEKKDVVLHILNKENKECSVAAYVAYDCADEQLQKASFTLGAGEEKTKTFPYGTISGLTMEAIYVRLDADAALRFWATTKDPEPLPEPIPCNAIATGTMLLANTEYAQDGGQAWYILSNSLKDSLATGELTAELHVWNESGADLEILGEAAFECPVEYEMAAKKLTIKKGQEFVKAIAANTALQLGDKENVILRLKAAGKFRFEVRVISAYNGNSRESAIRLKFNEEFSQAANTTMWYRVNTSDLKNIEGIDGKSLHVEAEMPEDNTTLEVAVFEGNSEDDLIEYYTGRKAKYTVEKAYTGKHNIPAYIVRALADEKIVYIRVTTDKPLSGRTSILQYKTRAEVGKEGIPTKKLATLVIPNVDYKVPGGKTGQWFAICAKDIKAGYMLTRDAGFTITNPNNKALTITTTATWQDSLTYDIPYRTRTIDEGARSYSMTVYEAIEETAKRKGHDISLDAINPVLIDSFARAYTTDDHIAAYIFIEHDGERPIEVRLKAKPTKGGAITNAIEYDWERGNVNPGKANEDVDKYARAKTWFMVNLDEIDLPLDKDLEFQVTNWSETEISKTKATILLDMLGTSEPKSIEIELAPGEKKTKRIDRKLLAGQSSVFIGFESSQANYIWADFIDTLRRDTVETFVTEPYCIGYAYEFYSEVCYFKGTLASDKDTLHFKEFWEEFRDDERGLHYYDSIVHHTVIPLRNPKLYLQGEVTLEPVVVKGANIDVSNTIASLKQQFAKDATDLTMMVADVKWQVLNGATWQDLPYYVEPTETLVTLRYIITTECGTQDTSANFVYHLTPECQPLSGTCGDNLTWELSCDSVLTISGTGPMTDYEWNKAPWFGYAENIVSVEISKGITSIGDYAFNHCSSISSVAIPSGVTSIGFGAFNLCFGLTSVNMPNTLTTIGEIAFSNCEGLTSVTIPNSVTNIENWAFENCRNLKSITSEAINPPVLDEWGGGAVFLGVPHSIPLYVPAESINAYKSADGWKYFTNIQAIKCVTASGTCGAQGDNLTWELSCEGILTINGTGEMENYSHSSLAPWYDINSSVTSAIIGNSVTSIGDRAFRDCTGLTSVTIPNSVTYIGDYAFEYCTGLTSIYNYAETPQVIEGKVFNSVDKSACVLYVQTGSIALYKAADVWKEFTNILPISAEEKEVYVVEVVTTESTASIAWPQVGGAYTYELVIQDKNGNVICSLTFNAQGQLTSIKFGAPAQNGAPQHTQTAGFAFTVTGLEAGTTYDYTIVAKGETGAVLNTETGSFTTLGGEQAIDNANANANAVKLFRDGQVLIQKGDKTFDLRGQEVK